VHVAVKRATGGRVARRWLGGSELVLLTTVGRRTGRPRTVTLMALRDGADFLVAASHGGVDREPPWWLNLIASPRAELEVRGERFPVTAEKVSDDERPALWARFVDAYAGFESYQARVRREIALVRLRREG
jgi:F420H(2)-dependent quinone reductase